MKNKNLKKIKYVSGNPQNAGFCTIYPTASGGLGGPQTPGLNCSASPRSPFSTYFFQNSLLLLKVLKALGLGQSLIMHVQNTCRYCKCGTDRKYTETNNNVYIAVLIIFMALEI
jgi:hypothetical protein